MYVYSTCGRKVLARFIPVGIMYFSNPTTKSADLSFVYPSIHVYINTFLYLKTKSARLSFIYSFLHIYINTHVQFPHPSTHALNRKYTPALSIPHLHLMRRTSISQRTHRVRTPCSKSPPFFGNLLAKGWTRRSTCAYCCTWAGASRSGSETPCVHPATSTSETHISYYMGAQNREGLEEEFREIEA